MKKWICFILFLVPLLAMGQRHSKSIGGIDVFGGYTLTHSKAWNAGLGYMNYLSSKDILKIQGEYSQFVKKLYDSSFTMKDYAINLEYLRTVYSNENNLYLNIGIGARGGYEDIASAKEYLNTDGKVANIKSRFYAAPVVVGEIEFFVLPKTAFIFHAKECYSPMSDVRKWNTSVEVGIRQLIF